MSDVVATSVRMHYYFHLEVGSSLYGLYLATACSITGCVRAVFIQSNKMLLLPMPFLLAALIVVPELLALLQFCGRKREGGRSGD